MNCWCWYDWFQWSQSFPFRGFFCTGWSFGSWDIVPWKSLWKAFDVNYILRIFASAFLFFNLHNGWIFDNKLNNISYSSMLLGQLLLHEEPNIHSLPFMFLNLFFYVDRCCSCVLANIYSWYHQGLEVMVNISWKINAGIDYKKDKNTVRCEPWCRCKRTWIIQIRNKNFFYICRLGFWSRYNHIITCYGPNEEGKEWSKEW